LQRLETDFIAVRLGVRCTRIFETSELELFG
jgi:hypothetical protein